MRAETAAAVRAARIAQEIADSRVGADAIEFKEGIDIVTGADVACEDAIRAELTRAFPSYPVIGEERGGEVRDGVPYWLVDPICGTRCYASNVPLYCTNIALVESGAVTAAAIGIGRTREVLYAERGAGAWLHGAAAANAERRGDAAQEPAAAKRIATSTSSSVLWVGGRKQPMADFARRVWLADRWYLWSFTSTVGYAYLAAGRIAGIVHFGSTSPGEPRREPPVHTAAGCLVTQEAGATVTDLATGGAWSLDTRSFLIAADPALHRELGELVAAAP